MYQASPDHKKRSTFQERVHRFIDAVAAFFGSVPFLLLNTLWFLVWLLLNTVAPAPYHFDNFPFNFLTLSVSLEAIYLSIFVLISQNRQGERDRLHVEKQERENKERQEADIRLNKEEEKQGREILEILNKQNETLADVIALLNKSQVKPVRTARKAEGEKAS